MFVYPEPTLQASTISISDGVPGIMDTIRIMRGLVKQYRADPAIRARATSLVRLLPQMDTYAESRTLFEYVRDSIRYTGDVLDMETVATPVKTLQTGIGDCDDKATLLAAMLESISIPTRFVVAGYSSPYEFEHVYIEAMLPNGAFIPLDPSDATFAYGYEAPHPLILWTEPV